MMAEVSSPPEYARTTFMGINSPNFHQREISDSVDIHGVSDQWLFCTPNRRLGDLSPKHVQQQRILRVHAILRLIVNDRPLRIDHLCRHLLPAMSRQAVHEDRIG